MKRFFILMILIAAVTAMEAAKPRTHLTVSKNRKQTITGFGAACCDGAMKPFGTDNACVSKLYGPKSKIGLNIMRMEISPSFTGDNWGDYDWNGSLPSAQTVKRRGGIVFGTPWSPPGDYKTNGTAQGGNADDQGYQKGKLREDCYEKFFPWLNSFLDWMQERGVDVDAVSIQNEPDWWVSYSGCLYDPQDLVKLVKNYAWMLDREKHPGVKLISAEPLGFTQNYTDPMMQDEDCRNQIDIIAGHIYGHPPLQYIKPAAKLPLQYGKEVWMTEHSVTDNIDHMPTWHENLIFAEELNECMLAGCTGYIYWYMRAHWAFCGTGKSWDYNGKSINFPENKKDELLPRAFVMSHFAKHVTGSTRLVTDQDKTEGEGDSFEYSAYIKGDSLIVMAIDTTAKDRSLLITLPYKVKSGELLLSTGNESSNLCQKSVIDIAEPTTDILVEMPARSLSTFIFMIDDGATAIEEVRTAEEEVEEAIGWYSLDGRKLSRKPTRKGVYIYNGKKVVVK